MATYWNEKNLAVTVHATQVGRRNRCSVSRPLKFPPYFVLEGGIEGVDYEHEDAYTNYHEWPKIQPDVKGKKRDIRCIHCKKTLKEIMEPKPISLHEALKGN